MCCDGSPFELMHGHLWEARQHISTAASALPNSAVKKGASTVKFGLQSLTEMPHMHPRALRRHRVSESDLLRDVPGFERQSQWRRRLMSRQLRETSR